MPDVRQPTQQLAIQANGAPVMLRSTLSLEQALLDPHASRKITGRMTGAHSPDSELLRRLPNVRMGIRFSKISHEQEGAKCSLTIHV